MTSPVDTQPVRALRDRLLSMGRPSAVPVLADEQEAPSEPDLELAAALERVKPFAELLFLVMVADRRVTESERMALRGAFRALTGGRYRSKVLEELSLGFEAALATQGWESRLESICAGLSLDREDAEGAFSLAAAMSLADGVLSEPERALLQRLSSWLGLGSAAAEALLSEAHQAREQ